MSQLSRSILRILLAMVASVGLLLCASTVEAGTFAKLDRLRILNQNMANKPWPVEADIGLCHDDNRCRARHIAQRILEGDYDVVILEEEFDEDSVQELITYLGHTFPYYIGQYDSEPIGQPWIDHWKHEVEVASLGTSYYLAPALIAAAEWIASLATTNSGTVIFSKWPLTSFANVEPSAGSYGHFDVEDDRTWEDETFHLARPYVFARFNECYHPWPDGTMPEIGDGVSNIGHISDCLAAKGVAAVRLLSPTGRYYNVFFTHPQASYGDLALSVTAGVRRAQLQQVNKLISDLHINTDTEEVVLAGDLNINGDQVQLADPAVTDKNEEWKIFDMGLPPGNNSAQFFTAARQLKDSWAYAMNAYYGNVDTSKDVSLQLDHGWTWTTADGGGPGNGRLDYVFLGRTLADSGKGRLPMTVQHTAVSYNIAEDVSATALNHGITSATSPGLIMHGGGERISDHWGLSAEIAPATAYCNPVNAYAIDPSELCTHNNRCISNTCTLSKQQCVEDSDCDCLQTIFNTFEQPGTAHWYRIDSPGTYAFRVNHILDDWALTSGLAASMSADTKLHYEIYQPSDLSRPYQAFGDLTSTSHPGGPCNPKFATSPDPTGQSAAGCSFESQTFDVRQAPFYVKVWHDGADWQSKNYPFTYDFTWQRNSCETKEQACSLYPSEELSEDDSLWRASSGSERWIALRVDRSDQGVLQHLRFHAEAPIVLSKGPRIGSISLMDAGGASLVTTTTYTPEADGAGYQAHFLLYSSNNLPPGSPPDMNAGKLDSDDRTFYIVAHRNQTQSLYPPEDFQFQVRWDTDLTWVMGSANAHKFPGNGSAPGWNIALVGETEDNDWPLVDVQDEDSWEWVVDSDVDCVTNTNQTCGLLELDMHVGDDYSDLPVPLGDRTNQWGERMAARQAFRFVGQFRARIWEWDDLLTGANDQSPWGVVDPMFPAPTLQGIPDPATRNHIVERMPDVGIGWSAGNGDYRLRTNRANSSPTKFCMQAPNMCDSAAFCCRDKLACEQIKRPQDIPGGACYDP